MNPVSDKSPIKDSEVQFGASLDFKICVPWKGDLEVINTGQKESTFAVIELLYILYIPEVKIIWWLSPPSEKYEFANWDDHSQYVIIYEKNTNQ